MKGVIIFRRPPQLGPMIGGIHTETGIREGRPIFQGVMLPKLIGDISTYDYGCFNYEINFLSFSLQIPKALYCNHFLVVGKQEWILMDGPTMLTTIPRRHHGSLLYKQKFISQTIQEDTHNLLLPVSPYHPVVDPHHHL
jgi:hypothetical protein